MSDLWQPATFADALRLSNMKKAHNVLVCSLKYGTRGTTRIEKTSSVEHFNGPRIQKINYSGI